MTPKAKTVYRCSECGAEYPKWAGRCETCGSWNTLVEEVVTKAPAAGGASARRIGGAKSLGEGGSIAITTRLRDVAGALAETVGTQLHLERRLLARDVQRLVVERLEARRDLEQQRRLADAGLAADEDERPRHDAAAEHAVELVDAGRDALGDCDVDLVDAPGFRRNAGKCRMLRGGRRGRGREGFFGERVPLAALGAPPEPLGRLRAARRAREDDFRLSGHCRQSTPAA